MSKFYFNGEIVSKEFDKMNVEDVCVADFQSFIEGLSDGESIELYFSSLGGDVLAGQQMVSLLKDAERNGHPTTANVTSIAASMASVIACACQNLKLYEGAYIMCHLPWTVAMGNSNDLQKQISTLEQIKNGMVKIYKTKFDLSDEEIDEMLAAETWIDSDNYKDYKLNCEIVENGQPLKIAASISSKQFKHIPTRILNMTQNENVEKEEVAADESIVTANATPVDEVKDEVEEQEEVSADESKPIEGVAVEEEQPTLTNAAEYVTLAECEKRVSGMQSAMAKQINDFKSQLQAKEEELISAKAQITSLNDSLNKSKEELSLLTSTLKEKQQALDRLNANVNAHAEELPTMEEGLAKCASPAEKVAFLKSGKYVH